MEPMGEEVRVALGAREGATEQLAGNEISADFGLLGPGDEGDASVHELNPKKARSARYSSVRAPCSSRATKGGATSNG